MKRSIYLLALLSIFWPPRANASAELRQALKELAVEVKKVLDGKDITEIALGKFDGPPSNKTAAGPGLTMILAEELGKLGIRVTEQSKFGLEGRYSLAETPATDPDDARIGKKVLAVKVKIEIIDAFDNRDKIDFERKVIQGGDRVVKGEAALARTFGPSVAFDPKATEVENHEALRKAIIVKPSCHFEDGRILSKQGQSFSLEVLVADTPCAPREKGGLAFVEIKRGEVYAVRLTNRADHEVAVQLLIDGISMYAFSEVRFADGPHKGEPKYSTVIVPAQKDGKPGTTVIQGWHKTNEKGGQDSFIVTEYAKSAAATLKRTEGLGTITAIFQAAWTGSDAPSDEPGKRRGGLGDATGFGPPAGNGFKEASRTLGVIRDCISVRYTIPN